ncbi:MAG: pentapeptide repeat-containing protein [Symploca sp. SIO2G7]|nr:pentapeptide repeat-containing protein [Symploca sp. SIO2G7]
MDWKILFTSLLGTKLRQGQKKRIRQSQTKQTPLTIRLQDRTEKKFDLLRWAEKFEATSLETFLDKTAQILEEVALFRILGVLSNLALLVAVVTWFLGRESRLQEKHYQAWAVINTAAAIMPGCENTELPDASETDCQIIQGSTGEGGRISAIEGLHRDKQVLEGLNVIGAYLREINLSPRCFLVFFNCHSVNLSKANFEGVDLSKGYLQGARLDGANLKRARFFRSNLTKK